MDVLSSSKRIKKEIEKFEFSKEEIKLIIKVGNKLTTRKKKGYNNSRPGKQKLKKGLVSYYRIHSNEIYYSNSLEKKGLVKIKKMAGIKFMRLTSIGAGTYNKNKNREYFK